jgi:hypothetical protein
MTKRVRIISDGTAQGTKVLDANGDPVKWGGSGLVEIEILPINNNGLVAAKFTVNFVELDVDAKPVLRSEVVLPP